MKLDHVANRISSKYYETVIRMFKEKIGFIELRRIDDFIWLRQPGANVDIQFCRSEAKGRDKDKHSSQIAFLSETPRKDLEDLALWAQENGMPATVGAYSDCEFYLDASDAFVDFVVEAMTPDQADYGPDHRHR